MILKGPYARQRIVIPVVVGSNPISHPTFSQSVRQRHSRWPALVRAVARVCAGLWTFTLLVPVWAIDEGISKRLATPVPIERLEVTPDPEDRPAPVKDRWVRFAEALGPGKSASRSVVVGTDASGVGYACYSPCFINCCVRGPDPAASVTGRNAGR